MISILSNSLPRFIVVPQKVLDTELKKSFAHFNEGRIPVSMSGFVGRSRVSLLRPKSRRFSLPMCSFSHCVLRCSAGVGDTPWAAICCGWPVFRTTSIMRKMTSGGCVRARVWVFRFGVFCTWLGNMSVLCCGVHRTKASVARKHFWVCFNASTGCSKDQINSTSGSFIQFVKYLKNCYTQL